MQNETSRSDLVHSRLPRPTSGSERAGNSPRQSANSASVLFFASFYVWTALVAVLLLPVTLASSDWAQAVARLWARGALWLLWWTVGLKYTVAGRENLPLGGAIVALKHQSAWETIALWVLLPNPAIVLKESLTRIPVLAIHFRRVGAIPIDRSSGAKAVRSLLDAGHRAILANMAIAIFPEGTRRPVGSLPAYQPGVAALYKYLNVPVVPIALNSGLFWPAGQPLKGPGVIKVEILPPILPGLRRSEFLARLQHDIERATDKLVRDARNATPATTGPTSGTGHE
jgi:1-acyl-sn-glycerol-3-phosphate acyltransferase